MINNHIMINTKNHLTTWTHCNCIILISSHGFSICYCFLVFLILIKFTDSMIKCLSVDLMEPFSHTASDWISHNDTKLRVLNQLQGTIGSTKKTKQYIDYIGIGHSKLQLKVNHFSFVFTLIRACVCWIIRWMKWSK